MTGPLLLPATVLALPLEEQGQRVLVEEALAGEGYVALLQPREMLAARFGGPAFYSVGCLGHIAERDDEHPEGSRVLVEGLMRFRVREELGPATPESATLRVRVDYAEFFADPRLTEGLIFPALRDVVRHRIETHQSFDPSILQEMAGTEIVTALAHAMPFCPAERQILVEAPNLRDLEDLLLHLMARGPRGEPGFDAAPLWVS